MKNYTVETDPVFSESIRVTETSDPAHAENINAAPKQLLENTLYNKAVTEEIKQGEQEVAFEDYTGEEAAIPEAEEAINQLTSGKKDKLFRQYVKAALKGLLSLAQRALDIALGKNQARVFATVAALDAWLAVPANVAKLNVGDNFYITATDVPDYWWDGAQKQKLETQKVDLTTYDQEIAKLKQKDSELSGNISSHTHDGRYFTESEMNTKLAGKLNTTGYITAGKKDGTTLGPNATAEGGSATASGSCSHAEGWSTTASGYNTHAEGNETIASDNNSHAEGFKTTASGNSSHAEGSRTTASGNSSHAEGRETTASGSQSHAEGNYTVASGESSHAEGRNTVASGTLSHAGGDHTFAGTYAQTVIGRFNVKDTNGQNALSHWLIIGNGSSDTVRSNAFRVDVSGTVFGKGAYQTSGADYAENFEWLDGNSDNEDRRGYFVTLDGNKIRKATSSDDYILGIVSATPVVVGNSDPDDWHGRFLRDSFGNYLKEMIEDEYTDENGETQVRMVESYIINPEFDPEISYIPRAERTEWSPVGMLGQLIVRDDGSCEVNGYCGVSDDGIATATQTGYRVIERVSENLVKVLFR